MQQPFILNTANVVAAIVGPPSSIAYLITPGMKNIAFSFVTPNAAELLTTPVMQPDYNNNIVNANYNFKRLPEDATKVREAAASLTWMNNLTDFNNTGTIACAQFNPNVLFGGTLLTMAYEKPELFLQHMVSEHKRSPLTKFGSTTKDSYELVYDAKTNWERFPLFIRTELLAKLGLKPDTMLNLDPNTTLQVVHLGLDPNSSDLSPVPTTNQIMQMSQRSYVGEMKDGLFLVNRLTTISPTFRNVANSTPAIGPYTAGFYKCYVFYWDTASGPHTIPLETNNAVGTTAVAVQVADDYQWSPDMTWAWVRMDGLTYNSNTIPFTWDLMAQKWYRVGEAQTGIASSWSGMIDAGPKPDLTAMQALMDAFYELKDGMPAKYNFLGTLSGVAMGGLQTFGSGLLKQLGGALLGTGKKTRKTAFDMSSVKSAIKDTAKTAARSTLRNAERAIEAPKQQRAKRVRKVEKQIEGQLEKPLTDRFIKRQQRNADIANAPRRNNKRH